MMCARRELNEAELKKNIVDLFPVTRQILQSNSKETKPHGDHQVIVYRKYNL